jgi:transcriptional regulator with XRE-family HTH domain
MPPTGSPTVRRWELASRLRAMRERANLNMDEVATQLLCSSSKISRIETGDRPPSLRDVRDLCQLYGATSSTQEELMTLLREAKQPGWWQAYDEVAARSATYIGLEDAATAIRQYETVRVPGLLQTPAYTRALMRRIIPSLSAEAVEQFVETRQARHERILRVTPSPRYWAILDEAVLARQVGGSEVMREQIEHLLACAGAQLVTLQLIPFSVGAHAGMEGSFVILEFDGALPDTVYVEGRSGQLFLNRPADLRVSRESLDLLQASASSPDESLAFMKQMLKHGPYKP